MQFRVLYRQFLFRLVDLEMLSARGDAGKLLGQFAAMLAAVSFLLMGWAARFANLPGPRAAVLVSAWPVEEFLISTTMGVVGLFTVLCWDSAFPDRRDVLVLAPLPIRPRTLFLAKMAALGTALSLTVAAVNVFTGFTYPIVLRPGGGFFGGLRSLAAYWITMLAAGGFLFCSALAAQGLAAQLLPRRLFLRVSAFLQLGAFFLILSVYFLEPSLATPRALTAPGNQRLLAALPPYWFLALFQELNGSAHPAFGELKNRAVTALMVAGAGAGAAFLLAYFRTLRKIVDEPDIMPLSRGGVWLPRLGDSLQTAVARFSARTLLRSRQHRLILAGYWGLGFAIALAYGKGLLYGQSRHPWYLPNTPLLTASIVTMCLAVVGIRPVFSLPLALRANWIFRVTAVRSAPEYAEATRRSLLLLAAAPVWTASAALFFAIWPPRAAAGHLVLLGLLGLMLADLRLYGFRKIPFTCSYLPGKANVHVISGAYGIVLMALAEIGGFVELRALESLRGYATLLAVMGAAAWWARWRTKAVAALPDASVQFEETPHSDIVALDLHRDGKLW
jgi:hypothetical protein